MGENKNIIKIKFFLAIFCMSFLSCKKSSKETIDFKIEGIFRDKSIFKNQFKIEEEYAKNFNAIIEIQNDSDSSIWMPCSKDQIVLLPQEICIKIIEKNEKCQLQNDGVFAYHFVEIKPHSKRKFMSSITVPYQEIQKHYMEPIEFFNVRFVYTTILNNAINQNIWQSKTHSFQFVDSDNFQQMP